MIICVVGKKWNDDYKIVPQFIKEIQILQKKHAKIYSF